jgi:hypothetical protein
VDVIDTFVAAGFGWIKASNSGQAISDSRSPWRIAGDAFFCREDMFLQVEVGGVGKRLAVAFEEMRSAQLPGAHLMVVRFVKGKRWYYVSPDDRFAVLEDAIDALKES